MPQTPCYCNTPGLIPGSRCDFCTGLAPLDGERAALWHKERGADRYIERWDWDGVAYQNAGTVAGPFESTCDAMDALRALRPRGSEESAQHFVITRQEPGGEQP